MSVNTQQKHSLPFDISWQKELSRKEVAGVAGFPHKVSLVLYFTDR